ncbi:MAG: tetratricopeptide repeat protein [Bdellovibrio sp.]
MTFFSIKTREKAALFMVALFFTSAIQAAGKVETYQDLIEKAYNLSLQKDRLQAVNLLVSAAQREAKKGQIPKELLTALEEVSTVFYSDKAQQAYELALSLRVTDPGLASGKLTEAARMEPDNLQILVEQMRMQVGAGDCDAAYRAAQKATERNPFGEDLRLAFAQAALCAGKIQEFHTTRNTIDLKKAGREIFWLALDLELAHRTGSFGKGRELSVQLSKVDASFPEAQYWLWKFNQGLKIPEERAGTKYLTLCKSISSRAARQYQAEPRLCRRQSEVEAEIKKPIGKTNE